MRIEILSINDIEVQKKRRARPGFEPGTSRTLSENHTPRPTSQHGWWPGSLCFIVTLQGQQQVALGVQTSHIGKEVIKTGSKWDEKKNGVDSGRTRTCNLLLRRQTRYPLRHRAGLWDSVPSLKVVVPVSSFLSVVVITCASHAQGRRFEPGRKHALLKFFFELFRNNKKNKKSKCAPGWTRTNNLSVNSRTR